MACMCEQDRREEALQAEAQLVELEKQRNRAAATKIGEFTHTILH